MKRDLGALLTGCSELLLMRGAAAGTVLLALTLVAPQLALAGVLCLASAQAVARLLGIADDARRAAVHIYNPLLVGLSIGYLYRPGWGLICVAVGAGALTVLVTAALGSLFSTHLKLPVLSLPFALVSTAVYLAAWKHGGLTAAPPEPAGYWAMAPDLPAWISGFLRSLGAIVFAPHVLVGAVVASLLVIYSRVLLGLAISGYLVGVVFQATLTGSTDLAFADANSFNFSLVAMAVGGIFLLPSPRSYLLSLVAVSVSVIMLHAITAFWGASAIPPFTLPFNLACLGTIYVLNLTRQPVPPAPACRPPEEVIEEREAFLARYPSSPRALPVPFAGTWTVWQAFDGQWTHQGNWRHAYDFVVTDRRGRTHSGAGYRLENYYAYGQPVLAPICGRVTRVVQHIPDNAPGQLNPHDRWGNHVIIYDARGFYVEISHFAPGSIRVCEGQRVEAGTLLGLCGNSGYSSQPHIHMQAQATGEVGAWTLPFTLARYAHGSTYHPHGLPIEGDSIEDFTPAPESITHLRLAPGETHELVVRRSGRAPRRSTLTVRIMSDGRTVLDSGQGQLSFTLGPDALVFHRLEGHDPMLAKLLAVAPRIPHDVPPGVSWEERLPLGAVLTGPRLALARLLTPGFPSFATVSVCMSATDRDTLESSIESSALGCLGRATIQTGGPLGIESIRTDDLTITRVHTSSQVPAPGPSACGVAV